MKREIFTSKAPKPVGPYSQAVEKNGFLFISGQLGIDPSTNNLWMSLEDQCYQALENIKNILEAAGYSLEDIVNIRIYLKNIQDFPKINEIYKEFFADLKVLPSRVVIEASNLPLNALVEIEALAMK